MFKKDLKRRGVLQKILKTGVGPEYSTRRAQLTDVDAIKRLYTDSTYKLFGHTEIDDLIHLCYLTMVLEQHQNLVAAICVNNYPNIPSIAPWTWEEWLPKKYRMEKATSRNSLWVHLAVFERRYKHIFLVALLQALFAKCPHVQFVFIVIPPGTWTNLDWFDKLGTELQPLGHSNAKIVQTIYIILRQHYVLNYKIRQAVAEDNDDIIPLIDCHSQLPRRMYGEYYIAEIILNKEKHDDRHLIVAEYGGEAVAVLCLNRYVNYRVANECFQLITFYGLKKPRKNDTIHFARSSTTFDRDADTSLYSFVFVCSDDECRIRTPSRSDEGSIIDLNKNLEELSLISVEDIVEEEEEEEFEAFRGHINLDISYDALEFSEKQLDCWLRGKRRSLSDNLEDETDAYFSGPGNAFTLEIAAARREHEAALNLLLEAAFELFPTKDYCIMSMPSESYSFPLTSKVFVRTAPKPESDFTHELYVVHHSAMSGELSVREARIDDVDLVRTFLKRMTKGGSVWDEFQKWQHQEYEDLKAYVIFCDSFIIGLAILSDVEDLEYILSHYQLSTWTDISKHKVGQHGLIRHFVLSPIFQRHIRFLLLELHRLSDYSLFFYIINPKDVEPTSSKALCCVLGDLIPVVPSKMPEYCTAGTSFWNLPEAVGRVERPYAIYISTPAYCGLTRLEINDKIIVVGASDVGIAFLVGLIFHNDPSVRVTFNNIILVSTHGLVPYKSNRFRDIMTPVTGDVSGYYLCLLSLPTYVTVITGVMSAIDRKNKTIAVNGTNLNYDTLILTCGKQYQMPKRSVEKRGTMVERPNNVFIVNTETDIDIVIKTLRELVEDDLPGSIIVYGYTLDAYCCLEAIIELGVPSSKIYFVLPPRYSDDSCSHNTIFNDGDVEDAVNANIQALGIQMYVDYEFVDWNFDEKKYNITSIKFESLTRVLDVECLAAFMYEKKGISTKTFHAIVNANLIFDGGVVIDTDCCTNDPNIYAAGTITKYSRRYYADHMKHCYFNRKEIGNKLGEHILHKLIRGGLVEPDENIFTGCRTAGKKLVPRYTQPLMVYARLPGKINYMNVKKPGLEIPLDVAMTGDDYGQVLTSGDCKNITRQGYFRLHLNIYNTVETITCLTKKELEKVNLTHLWGKHEKLLNNLVTRFEMVTITDLFNFFSEPWSYAIYHDRFEKLNTDINEILTRMSVEEGASILEDITQKLVKNNWQRLTSADFREQIAKFDGSEYQKKVTEKVLEFLIDNYNYLPMYANPMAVNVILAGCEESPMFNKI
ncbi:hypothetical protein Trydic_g3715 [Trypoxylus dichotomus]